MWGWLRALFGLGSAAPRGDLGAHGSRVWFDADGICYRNADGIEQRLGWGDLASVSIITTDTGPFEVDLHWLLTCRDGGQSISVPMGAAGEQDLLRELQRRLPDFDNETVVLAMSSTVNAIFYVWRARPASAA